MKLYTIGFTQKSAEDFFCRIRTNHVKCVIDIRIHPDGQLSGFARKDDLPFFLDKLANGCGYLYLPDLAPTKEILKSYRESDDWETYVEQFEDLLDMRDIPTVLQPNDFDDACLLCSEDKPDQCHRRLVAERLAKNWSNVRIVHL
jgi:uncharacterized protein (DUF488 family)